MKVKRIIEEAFKSGVSQKNGKEWVIAKVELENGETASAFQPVKVGDGGEVTENEYGFNFRVVRPDPKFEAIYKSLNSIEEKVDKLLGLTDDDIELPD